MFRSASVCTSIRGLCDGRRGFESNPLQPRTRKCVHFFCTPRSTCCFTGNIMCMQLHALASSRHLVSASSRRNIGISPSCAFSDEAMVELGADRKRELHIQSRHGLPGLGSHQQGISVCGVYVVCVRVRCVCECCHPFYIYPGLPCAPFESNSSKVSTMFLSARYKSWNEVLSCQIPGI